jgi:predicted lipoprotein with Yx(FWY)xxD motif
MQKVVGSSPIIRFDGPGNGAFSLRQSVRGDAAYLSRRFDERRGMIRWILPVALGATIAAGAATATTRAPSVKLAASATFGKVLVGPSGRTLYRFTVDSKGVNRCTKVASCAKYWPQLLVKAGAKPTAGAGVNARLLGTIKAAHGMAQVTYAGFPLYYFAGDTKAGAVNGQGLDADWYVVNARGALVKSAASGGGAGSGSTGTTSGSGGSSGGGWG